MNKECIILVFLDYIGIIISQYISIFIRKNLDFIANYSFNNHINSAYLYFIIPAIFLMFLYTSGVYDSNTGKLGILRSIFKAVIFASLSCIAIMYFGHVANGISRLYVLILTIDLFVILILFRYILNHCFSKTNVKPIVIFGAGKTSELLIKEIGNDSRFKFNILGFLDDAPKSQLIVKNYKILGNFSQAIGIIDKYKVKTVIISAPGISKEKLLSIINNIQLKVQEIYFVPDLLGTPVFNMKAQYLYESKILILKINNNLNIWYNKLLKSLFDLSLSIVGMCFIWPIFLLIGIAIYISSPGTIFFAHRRIGKGGKSFFCYKFRSMVNNSQEVLEKTLRENSQAREEWNKDFKLKDDPRITPIGNFLRRTSLDELPQLFNVLKGDMSLVGPRPIVKDEICKYKDSIKDYYEVLPGITGLWQVSGRNDVTYDERVQMDSWYVHNWSIWLDMMILYKTIRAVVNGNGCY